MKIEIPLPKISAGEFPARTGNRFPFGIPASPLSITGPYTDGAYPARMPPVKTGRSGAPERQRPYKARVLAFCGIRPARESHGSKQAMFTVHSGANAIRNSAPHITTGNPTKINGATFYHPAG